MKVIHVARRTTPVTPETPVLSVEQCRLRIAQFENCIRDLEAFDPQKVQKRHGIPEVMALEAAIKDALAAAFGHRTPAYHLYERAASLDNGPHIIRGGPMFGGQVNYDAQDAHEARQYLAEGKQQSIALLKEAIKALERKITDQEAVLRHNDIEIDAEEKGFLSRKVFIVHGHDEGAREAVARFLERIRFEAIILHEQANKGRTVIEKVVAHGDVGFAVVLLTPDDEGCKKGEDPKPRARQNVLLELGYFVGRLGRERVCALRRGNVELPSDFGGVVYEPFDDGGGWRQTLGRELEAVGFEVDWNLVMRP
jgi:predicted nucleotide-binding protein